MKHLGTQTLETSRLILRPFNHNDAPAMYKNWASDTEVVKYLTWPVHSDVKITESLLNNWITAYSNPSFYQWAIVPKDINEPIGSISCVHMDEAISMIEIGYCIGQHWWHQGITSEALNSVIAFFFEKIGANRIQARHDVHNPNSGKVMSKCGMKYEGTMRDAAKNNQGICDMSIYAILKFDYESNDNTVELQQTFRPGEY